jgi:hypothetical protein
MTQTNCTSYRAPPNAPRVVGWATLSSTLSQGSGCPSTRQTSRRESYRVCRRAHSLRGWSSWHDPVGIPRGTRAGRSDGPRARRRAPVAVGGDCGDRPETRVHERDPAALGAAGRARYRPARRPDDGRAPTVEGSGARESRVETGERHLAESVGVFCPPRFSTGRSISASASRAGVTF